MASINSGLPLLREMAARDNAIEEFEEHVKRGLALVPKEDDNADKLRAHR
jgi:hypothetical protein